jgi:hypothetical protein
MHSALKINLIWSNIYHLQAEESQKNYAKEYREYRVYINFDKTYLKYSELLNSGFYSQNIESTLQKCLKAFEDKVWYQNKISYH